MKYLKDNYPIVYWLLFPVVIAIGILALLNKDGESEVVSTIKVDDDLKKDEVDNLKAKAESLEAKVEEKQKEIEETSVKDNWYEKP